MIYIKTNGKNKKVIIITIVIVLIIVSVGIYALTQTNDAEGMSAQEAKNISDNIVQNINITLPLYRISATGSMYNAYPNGEIDDSGNSSIWSFTYCKTNETTHVVELFEIFVFSNGSSRAVCENYSGAYFNVTPVNNWSIDSNEAFEIAKNNEAVKEFRSTYSGEYINVFALYWDEECQREVWKLTWRYEGPLDNIEQVTILIDANTGNIL